VILSDRSIREELASGRLVVEPICDDQIQPASIDLRAGDQFRVFHNQRKAYIDVKEDQADLTELVSASAEKPFILHPGEFALGATLERVTLPDDLVARLEGKSSLGRLGLLIHSTAGFIDPGFSGHITLELSNIATLPITIYPDMQIGQISFYRLTTPADRPYGSAGNKYHGQTGPTPSKFHEVFEKDV
jgi:dCTP deaminase